MSKGKTVPPFFAGKIGTARLFFFVGLGIVIASITCWVIYTSPAVWVVILGALGIALLLVGIIQIWTLNEPESSRDFH